MQWRTDALGLRDRVQDRLHKVLGVVWLLEDRRLLPQPARAYCPSSIPIPSVEHVVGSRVAAPRLPGFWSVNGTVVTVRTAAIVVAETDRGRD